MIHLDLLKLCECKDRHSQRGHHHKPLEFEVTLVFYEEIEHQKKTIAKLNRVLTQLEHMSFVLPFDFLMSLAAFLAFVARRFIAPKGPNDSPRNSADYS